MDRETQLQLLVDHYRRPRHRGPMPDADAHVPGGNPGCGDVITMHLKADPAGERVERVSFEGEGCTLSQAAASILAERFNRERPTLDEVRRFTPERMIDLLGRELVESRPRCATLALGTLQAAARVIDINRKLRAAGKTDEQIAELRRALQQQGAGTGLVFGEQAATAAGGRVHE
jgi:nitrogen fixation NifU-like protein